jgi:hypothetical protein
VLQSHHESTNFILGLVLTSILGMDRLKVDPPGDTSFLVEESSSFSSFSSEEDNFEEGEEDENHTCNKHTFAEVATPSNPYLTFLTTVLIDKTKFQSSLLISRYSTYINKSYLSLLVSAP